MSFEDPFYQMELELSRKGERKPISFKRVLGYAGLALGGAVLLMGATLYQISTAIENYFGGEPNNSKVVQRSSSGLESAVFSTKVIIC